MASSPLEALQSAWSDVVTGADSRGRFGIDLVEVGAFRRLLESGGSSFVDLGWSKAEQQEAKTQPEALAGKWAAKEAVMKVLGRGIGELDPRDIEVLTADSGAPHVNLRRAARRTAREHRMTRWHISITHEAGWAAAIAAASRGLTVAETGPRRIDRSDHD